MLTVPQNQLFAFGLGEILQYFKNAEMQSKKRYDVLVSQKKKTCKPNLDRNSLDWSGILVTDFAAHTIMI